MPQAAQLNGWFSDIFGSVLGTVVGPSDQQKREYIQAFATQQRATHNLRATADWWSNWLEQDNLHLPQSLAQTFQSNTNQLQNLVGQLEAKENAVVAAIRAAVQQGLSDGSLSREDIGDNSGLDGLAVLIISAAVVAYLLTVLANNIFEHMRAMPGIIAQANALAAANAQALRVAQQNGTVPAFIPNPGNAAPGSATGTAFGVGGLVLAGLALFMLARR